MKKLLALFLFLNISSAFADDIGCVSTKWRVVNDDKICVESLPDPDISGITCHISYAKTGGVSGMVGLATDISRYSVACRQTGPIVFNKKIDDQETIFKKRMSLIFKDMQVVRMNDKKNNTLVYLIYSDKVIDGSPFNSISSVPLMPWGTTAPKVK